MQKCRKVKYALRMLIIFYLALSLSCSEQQPAPVIEPQSDDTTNPVQRIPTFAILKLSYNEPGDSSLVGGICGTGFFVGPSTAITANHVLNDSTFTPNTGFRHCRVWLIMREGTIYSIDPHATKPFPMIDTTVIRLNGDKEESFWSDRFDRSPVVRGAKVRGFGHIGSAMPKMDVKWDGDVLRITKVDLASAYSDRSGHVAKVLEFDVNANDVKLKNVRGFQVSFPSRVGMSGGPVVNAENGQVLGMLTFALPPDADIRTQTFAVSINEIIQQVFEDGT